MDMTAVTTLPSVQHVYQNHHLDSTRWQDYTPRPDDIVISTSYKSGTTWTQGIVRSLIFLGGDAPPLHQISPWLDMRMPPIDEVIQTLESQTHRRFIKTHLPLDGLPFYPQVKYIVVGRDARDVFMSLWNHYSSFTAEAYTRFNDTPGRVGPPLPPFPTDIHAVWRDWITRGWFEWESEGYPFWGNMRHIQTWWNFRHLDNILFVHFNDLLTDLKTEIQRIAQFLDIEISDEAVTTVAEAVSLPAMRRDAEQSDRFASGAFRGGAGTFFFKGTNGRWRDVLSADELVLYDEKASEVLTPACARWLEQGRLPLAVPDRA